MKLTKTILICLLVLGPTLFTFWNVAPSVPRGDHTLILLEWFEVQNNGEFLETLTFLSRMRKHFPGDYYLYRPVMTGVLGIIEVVFGDNLYVVGWIGI